MNDVIVDGAAVVYDQKPSGFHKIPLSCDFRRCEDLPLWILVNPKGYVVGRYCRRHADPLLEDCDRLARERLELTRRVARGA